MRSTRKEPLFHQRKSARAAGSEADWRWIDGRYPTADCLAKHASRKSEEVLQEVINQAAQWRITAEETMLETRREQRQANKVSSGVSEGGI